MVQRTVPGLGEGGRREGHWVAEQLPPATAQTVEKMFEATLWRGGAQHDAPHAIYQHDAPRATYQAPPAPPSIPGRSGGSAVLSTFGGWAASEGHLPTGRHLGSGWPASPWDEQQAQQQTQQRAQQGMALDQWVAPHASAQHGGFGCRQHAFEPEAPRREAPRISSAHAALLAAGEWDDSPSGLPFPATGKSSGLAAGHATGSGHAACPQSAHAHATAHAEDGTGDGRSEVGTCRVITIISHDLPRPPAISRELP